MNDINIDTGTLQILSASEAHTYRLVPYSVGDQMVSFYGDQSDYSDVVTELEVILGKNISIIPLEVTDFERLMAQSYRENKSGESVKTIQAGQGFLMALIAEAFSCGASDIHIEAYEEKYRIRLRIDGRLIERYVMNALDYGPLVNQIKIMSGLDISEKRLPQDGRIFYNQAAEKFDVRVSSLPAIHGEKIVMRLLTRRVELLDIHNLGFDERQLADYLEAVRNPHGLVLITGPTGAGKSTTLYATLRLLNEVSNNILTIEDPVEYTLEGVNQVQLKEEIGLTFGSALRTFLRQDPDIIMLGEIRDGDTAQMAIRSALTGHLVFSTLHTNSAWGAVSRLADMDAHPYLIAGTLMLCVAQRLVRLLCPGCKHRSADGEYFEAAGCKSCYFTGYSGRKAIYEVVKIDNELRSMIRDCRNDVDEILRRKGIKTLADSARKLVCDGLTSLEEVLPVLK